ncbi:MAG TPA: hypothetical protein VGC21_00060 [Telluria sp.]
MLRLVLAGAGAVLALPVLACSCQRADTAGFIHAQVKHLPANARGALFLPPSQQELVGWPGTGIVLYRGTLTPVRGASFRITVDDKPAALPVELTALDTPRSAEDRALRAFQVMGKADAAALSRQIEAGGLAVLLKAGTLREITAERATALRLMRVGPVGGFQPGHRYTIRYLDDGVARWAYPREVQHTIDPQPVSTGAAGYGLVADGAPLRRLLELVDYGGSCSSAQPAIVQDFHYVLPATHARYRDAMLYFSASRVARRPASVPRGAPWPPRYVQSLCGGPTFGLSARPGGEDLIHTSCDAPSGSASVSGAAGLLEVEDRVWPAGVLQVDFGVAPGSCRGYDMFSAALASGDKRRIAMAACGLARETWQDKPDTKGAPAMTALLPLMTANDQELARCTGQAAARLLFELPDQSAPVFDALAKMNLAALRSGDAERVEAVLDTLLRATGDVFWREHEKPADLLRNERLLLPVMPALIDLGLAGNARVDDLIAVVAAKARPFAPRLMAAARQPAPRSMRAIAILEDLIPDDPAFHALLVGHAAAPDMLAPAALVYERVAGKRHLEQAVALLAAAAEAGSTDAMGRLGERGKTAQASMPGLIRYLGRCGKGQHCIDAIHALARVSSGEPAAIEAISAALARQRAMSAYSRDTLRQAISVMGLSAAQRTAMLALLQKVPDGMED